MDRAEVRGRGTWVERGPGGGTWARYVGVKVRGWAGLKKVGERKRVSESRGLGQITFLAHVGTTHIGLQKGGLMHSG